MVLKYWMRKKSQYMDEAGIPMLVSRYIKITVYIRRVQRGQKYGTYCWGDHV